MVSDNRARSWDVGPRSRRSCLHPSAELRWAAWFLAALGVEPGPGPFRTPASAHIGGRVDLATHGPVLPTTALRAEYQFPRHASVGRRDYEQLWERAVARAGRIQARRPPGRHRLTPAPGGY